MAIKIIDDEPDIVLTRSEHDRLYREFSQTAMGMVNPPTFEEFVRQRKHNEAMQNRVNRYLPGL